MRLDILIFILFNALYPRFSEGMPGKYAETNMGKKISTIDGLLSKADEIFKIVKVGAEKLHLKQITKYATIITKWFDVAVPFFRATAEDFLQDAGLQKIKDGFLKVQVELQEVTRSLQKSMRNIADAHRVMLNVGEDQHIMIVNELLLDIIKEINTEDHEEAITQFRKAYKHRGKGISLFKYHSRLEEYTIDRLSSVTYGDCTDFEKNAGIMINIMVMGIQNEIVDLMFDKAPDDHLKLILETWTKKLNDIDTSLQKHVNDCKDSFKNSVVELVYNYLNSNTNKDADQITKPLRDKLDTDYDFMYWLVIVYDPTDVTPTISGNAVIKCDANEKRQVIVAYIEKSENFIEDIKCPSSEEFYQTWIEKDERKQFRSIKTHDIAQNVVIMEWEIKWYKTEASVKPQSSSSIPDNLICIVNNKDKKDDLERMAWLF